MEQSSTHHSVLQRVNPAGARGDAQPPTAGTSASGPLPGTGSVVVGAGICQPSHVPAWPRVVLRSWSTGRLTPRKHFVTLSRRCVSAEGSCRDISGQGGFHSIQKMCLVPLANVQTSLKCLWCQAASLSALRENKLSIRKEATKNTASPKLTVSRPKLN